MGVIILESLPEVKKKATIEIRLLEDLLNIWNSGTDFAELVGYNINAYTISMFIYVRDKIVIDKVIEEMDNGECSEIKKQNIDSFLRLPTINLAKIMDIRVCNTKNEKHMWVIVHKENIQQVLKEIVIQLAF